MENLAGMTDVAREMLSTFLKTLPLMHKAIENSLAEADAKSLQLSAHTLKGTVANFHALDAERLSAQLEDAAALGDLARAREIWSEISPELELLTRELAQFLRFLSPAV